MSAVLVDSNVLIDIATEDSPWGHWSGAMIARLADSAFLVINPIVYAEVSAGYTRIEDIDKALPPAVYRREPLPYEAAFLAAKCPREHPLRGRAMESGRP